MSDESGYVSEIFGGGDRHDAAPPDSGPAPEGRVYGRILTGFPTDFYAGVREERAHRPERTPRLSRPRNSRRDAGAAQPDLLLASPECGTDNPMSNFRRSNTDRIPPFEFHAVLALDRVYAGRNPLTGNNVRKLREAGITHLLDLREPWEWTAPRRGEAALAAVERLGLVRLSAPIQDATAPFPEVLDCCVLFLADVLKDPAHRVMIHCRAGQGRTGALLLAYAARYHYPSVRAALVALRSYPLFFPLPHQVQAVTRWIERQRPPCATPPRPASARPEGQLLPCDACAAEVEVAPAVVSFLCRECVRNLFRPTEPVG